MSAYVRQSATLKCTMGSAQSALQLSHPVSPVLLCGSPMAGMADIKPVANLAPFGLCKSLANPAVAAATAAAGGKLQEMPCIPCVTSPWAYAKMNVLVKGRPALTDDSRCVCMWLGIIKVKAAGQNSVVDTAPPPFITEDPQPPATATTAAPQTKDGDPKAAGSPTPQGGAPQTPKKGLRTSITESVKASIKNAVNKVKDRAASAASAISTAVQGYVTAILTTAGAAIAAAVGGILGARVKRDDKEAAASQEAAPIDAKVETGTAGTPPSAVTTAKTEITAKLIRNYFNDKRTFGTFEVFRGDESIFKCYTCEDTVRGDGDPDTVAKWKIAKESAIPYGIYTCKFTYSNRFKRKMWLVDNVPGFAGIRIHRGKNETWTEGCLLLGNSIANNYTLLDNSEETVIKFEKHMDDYGNQDFTLEITKI